MKIQGFSNYEIYPQEGRIWSYKSNKFIGSKQKDGYWHCALYGDDGTQWNTSIHRVIWTAVNGVIPQGYEINHLDENKNNSISNLELVTHKENMNYGTRNERVSKALKGKTFSEEHKNNISKAMKGKPSNNPSKQVAAYKDGELVMVFPSTYEAHRQGYNRGAICSCCNGLRQSHKGFQWRYL